MKNNLLDFFQQFKLFLSGKITLIDTKVLSSLAIPALIVFIPLLGLDFFFLDDYDNIIKNVILQHPSFSSLTEIWTLSKTPIPQTIWLIIKALFPTSGAFPYLLLNLTLHILNSYLVFKMALNFFTKLSNDRLDRLRYYAFFTAAIFLLHPLQVQVVSWASELRTELSTFFLLVSFHHFNNLGSLSKNQLSFYHFSLFFTFFILAILTKPIVASFTIVLPFYSLLFLKDKLLDASIKTLPVFILTVLIGIFHIQDSINVNQQVSSLLTRILTTFYTNTFYFKKFLLPIDLNFVYAVNRETISAFFDENRLSIVIQVILLLFLLIVLSTKKKLRPILFSLLTAVALLLPTSGIVDFNYQMTTLTADRYIYLALIPLSFSLAYTLLLLHPILFSKKFLTTTILTLTMITTTSYSLKRHNVEKILKDAAGNNILFDEVYVRYLMKHNQIDKVLYHLRKNPETTFYFLTKLTHKIKDDKITTLSTYADMSLNSQKIVFHDQVYNFYLEEKKLLRAKEYLKNKAIMYTPKKQKKLLLQLQEYSKKLRADSLNLIGDTYTITGDKKQAFAFYTAALKNGHRLKNKRRILFMKEYIQSLNKK